jgi:Putative Actinobacterial Holin-X, holin superfamily III
MIEDQQTSELGKAIQEVSEKASLLIREELALAQAELKQKAMGLARGAAIGAAAGIFIVAGLIYLLHALSWLIWKLIDDGGTSYYLGFLIVAGVLFLLGGLAGFLASRLFRKSVPPTPQMAIEEAQLIRETLTRPEGHTS